MEQTLICLIFEDLRKQPVNMEVSFQTGGEAEIPFDPLSLRPELT